ncbi:peroxidase isoform X2 [Cephus cinctus]|uniref:Peroxidase isoform X2 n=1 Tax=Cephus cinctus TaxID=211228 RepID=A0AAJ7C2Z1_CEPCN|nr:peroxidase isoform X2 [Cephus cinctus]
MELISIHQYGRKRRFVSQGSHSFFGKYGNIFSSTGPQNFIYKSPSSLFPSSPLSSYRHSIYIDPSMAETVMCGDRFNRQCQKSRYRTFDGSCNNPRNPTWGMANTRYSRLLPANYADGIHEPTHSVSGRELPLARRVSFNLFPRINIEDKQFTLAAMQFGQLITHDMAMIDGTTQSKNHARECCTPDNRLLEEALSSPLCYPVIIPPEDPVLARNGANCMNFVRSITDLDRGCSSQHEPAEQLTVVTHFLDMSMIYGSNDQTVANLRAGIGGRMNVDIRNHRQWPPASNNKTGTCDIQSDNEVCYQAGDARANQNPQLTILQIMLLREHNRVADILTLINPHWSDETIFQETRRIVIAEYQHISYYEWLPLFLGLENVYRHKILYHTKDYVNDYDSSVNPSVLNEHSNAAFRHFHSLIAGRLSLVNELRYSPNGRGFRLSDVLNKPGILEEADNMDDLTRGMASQPQEASDEHFDKEITEFLFRSNQPTGTDLRAIDIQRNRDHGLASYNDYRAYCGLPKAKHFNDFLDVISFENVEKLAAVYDYVDDVDLTVGGSLEKIVNGALVGPTFLCILHEQFYRTRVGDRFWYENGDSDFAFTIEQLNEIRKASVSRLFCDNGNHIQTMQLRGFELISKHNPVVRCSDLPAVDLSLWKDYAPQAPKHSSYIYDYNKK